MDPNDWTLTGNANTDPATNFLGTTDNQPLIINPSGNVNIGIHDRVISYPKLTVTGPDATINVEATEVLRVMRHGVPRVKNQNSAGLFVGAFEPGENGRSRLDFNVAGTPGPSNTFGSVPDVTVMTLQGNGSVGIGTTNLRPENVLDVQTTDTRTAVSGSSSAGVGVSGASDTHAGVTGFSTGHGGAAVVGNCAPGTGVVGVGGVAGVTGNSTLGNGVTAQVFGDQAAVVGVSGSQAQSGLGSGVFGTSISGAGVSAASQNGAAVDATSVSNWCGFFHSVGTSAKGVFVSVPVGQPGLQVASGTKNAVVATSQGSRALHTEESTAVWFTDYGFGKLQGGHAAVTIDPLFAETVSLSEPYHVFVQLNDVDAEGVAVVNKTALSFDVVEIRDGNSNAEFSYRLVAKRRGYEQNRLEQAPWADDDPNLYPEKRSTWEAQQRQRHPEIPQIDVSGLAPERP
jgi:hypothetical protein